MITISISELLFCLFIVSVFVMFVLQLSHAKAIDNLKTSLIVLEKKTADREVEEEKKVEEYILSRPTFHDDDFKGTFKDD